jgi:hypothetical protein
MARGGRASGWHRADGPFPFRAGWAESAGTRPQNERRDGLYIEAHTRPPRRRSLWPSFRRPAPSAPRPSQHGLAAPHSPSATPPAGPRRAVLAAFGRAESAEPCRPPADPGRRGSAGGWASVIVRRRRSLVMITYVAAVRVAAGAGRAAGTGQYERDGAEASLPPSLVPGWAFARGVEGNTACLPKVLWGERTASGERFT